MTYSEKELKYSPFPKSEEVLEKQMKYENFLDLIKVVKSDSSSDQEKEDALLLLADDLSNIKALALAVPPRELGPAKLGRLANAFNEAWSKG